MCLPLNVFAVAFCHCPWRIICPSSALRQGTLSCSGMEMCSILGAAGPTATCYGNVLILVPQLELNTDPSEAAPKKLGNSQQHPSWIPVTAAPSSPNPQDQSQPYTLRRGHLLGNLRAGPPHHHHSS